MEWTGGSELWNSTSQAPEAWPNRSSGDGQQVVVVVEGSRLQPRTGLSTADAAGGYGGGCWRRRSVIDTVPEGEELNCTALSNLEAACDAAAGSWAAAGAAAAAGADVGVAGVGGAEGRLRRSSSMESTMRGRGRLKYQGTGGSKPNSSSSSSSSSLGGGSFALNLLPQHLQDEARQGEQQWLQQKQQPPMLQEEQEQTLSLYPA
eukprot:scaffold36533_cov18-Tisochrysis_lutea.AAC.1